MIPWPLVVLLMATAMMIGLWFGHAVAMRVADEWIADHVKEDHPERRTP